MSDLDECRQKLPIWVLFGALGLSGADKVLAWGGQGGEVKICSPFRPDKNPSFSVWEQDGHGFWKDHGSGESGDEIQLIQQARGLDTKEAILAYKELAGVRSNYDGGKSNKSRTSKPAKKAASKKPAKKIGKLASKLEGQEVPKKSYDGERRKKIVETYDYLDESGDLLHQTLRFEPKAFRQRRPAWEGEIGEHVREGWVWSLKDSRVVPYHLPELLAAPVEEPVFFVEGEKDVENLERLEEVIATSVPMGAGKWRPEYAKHFEGRWVVIIPDHDIPGLEGAEVVARALFEVADRVSILSLDTLWSAAKAGDDVSDWLEGGWEIGELIDDQRERLMKLAEKASVDELDLFAECVHIGKRGGLNVLQDRLARTLVKNENLVYCGDHFWQWNGGLGIWNKHREKTWIERQVRRRIVGAGAETEITSSLISSVVSLAKSERVRFPEGLNCAPEGFFPVRNGLLDLESGKLHPHRSGYLATVQIPHNYDPSATCPGWEQWIAERQDDQATIDQIQEVFGYCLATHINYHAFFFFYGDGGTGKSTCVNVLEWLVGEDNKVAVELTELDNPFMRSQLVGKQLALAKELTTSSFKHIGLIKAIVSGDPINVDVKYGTGFDFRPTCRLVMESNVIAASPDSSNGFERRFIQINFDKKIDPKSIDFGFERKFKKEMSGILNWALVGYRRLKERGRFEHTEKSLQATEDFKKHRAQVESFLRAGWLEEVAEASKTTLCVTTSRIFAMYEEWCEQEDVVPFYKELATFCRELFTKRPQWRARKKRGMRDGQKLTDLMGIQDVKPIEEGFEVSAMSEGEEFE